jgi:hypothetical protein
MGADLEVQVLYRGGNPNLGAKGKGVVARRGLKEAGGETHDWRNTKHIGGVLAWVSQPNMAKPGIAKRARA